MQWNENLKKQGVFLGAEKLTTELGHTLRATPDKKLQIDGPYTEAKEAVAGFYHIRCASIEQACEFGKACPLLQYGGSVEVREVSTPATAKHCHSDG